MGRRRLRRSSTALPEITLTPLIDAALTLLIIFMVATPMIRKTAVKVELPTGEAKEGGGAGQQGIIVTIPNDNSILINNTPVEIAALAGQVRAHIARSKNNASRATQTVWIEVDKKKCSAGMLVTVIDQLRVVGGIDVALKTEPPRLHA